MDEKQAKLLSQFVQFILLLVVIASAPVWLPFGLIILAPTFCVAAGIVATIALGFTTFLALFLGIFGIPLLFITTVIAMAFIACTLCVKITWKIHSLCTTFYSHLDSTKFNRNEIVEWVAGNTRGTVQGFFAKLVSILRTYIKVCRSHDPVVLCLVLAYSKVFSTMNAQFLAI